MLRCPTCRARQEPAAECRRCRCDLSLVTAALGQQRALRAAYLEQLQAGRYAVAVHTARQLWELSPDETAARQLAVAYLLCGRYRAALDVYNIQTKMPAGD
jgi:Flp pilus assembly protein TadD